jgi:Lectin C-type domain
VRSLFLCAAVALAAACGDVFVPPDIAIDSGLDAGIADAPRAVDGPPVDAPRACTGGDGQVIDPATGTCFMVFRTVRTRAEAQAACVAIGANLASARTSAQNTLLTNLIGAASAFLGGNDLTIEGDFRWTDGTALTFKNWRANAPPTPNEPNNGAGLNQEDCLVIEGAMAGVWDDKPCDASQVAAAGKYQFVCERR